MSVVEPSSSSSSSSSSNPTMKKYDVFLSFRGEDTRNNFVSHLYAALRHKNVQVYIDEKSLDRGDEISSTLLTAIQESKISIVAFSENYAFSSWCLGELMQILDCHKKDGQIVVPVFYNVDPSHIRKQQGSYGAAFVEHENRFWFKMDMVQKWRAALTESASLSGWDSRVIRPESKLVEDIANDILKKLNLMSTRDNFKNLFGIHGHVKKVEGWLWNGSPKVRIIGIWGMGGIGKTTLAEVVFSRIRHQFESSCFLANVREVSKSANGLIKLRNKLLESLLDEGNKNAGTPSFISPFVQDRLRRRKVLVVLDDVDKAKLLEPLVGDCDWFSNDSQIIVTTRDQRVLRAIGVLDEILNVEGLDFDDSLRLFTLKAFKGNSPTKDYMELSKKVVRYAGGIPLALKVLGSYFGSFRSQSRECWEMALEKLKKVPHDDIQSVLRISYDGLDETEKDIFLDISCFFKGENRHHVEDILNGCDSFAKIGIDNLVDMCLITITCDNELWMHDLLQEMGWNIVRQQSKTPGKRSRLWTSEDACHVLKKNKGSATIEGIFLDMSKIDEDIDMNPTVLQTMDNLRLLKIYNSNDSDNHKVYLRQDLHSLPNSLRYLSWQDYPSKSLPPKFKAQNLVQLEICSSTLTQLWDGVLDLRNLKHLDLSYSKQLVRIPDLSRAINLRSVNLEHCTSLVYVPPINIRSCDNLDSELQLTFDTKALGSIRLGGCSNLRTPSEILGNVKLVDLNSTAVEELPSSVGFLRNLVHLNLENCKFLKNLPSSIRNLESMTSLRLSGCASLDKFPEVPKNIKILDVSLTAIEQIPLASIENLSFLTEFTLNRCKSLANLPTSFCKLKSLKSLSLLGCSNLKNFPEISEHMNHLESICLSGTAIQALPSSIGNLIGLQNLVMRQCENLEYVLHYLNMKCLKYLSLAGCSKLGNVLPKKLDLHSLTHLDLSYCNVSEIPEWLGSLSSLFELNLEGNDFARIPASIREISRLYVLNVKTCRNLQCVPELPLSMEFLDASECISLEMVLNLSTPLAVKRFGCYRYKVFLFGGCSKFNHHTRYKILSEFQLRISYDTSTQIFFYYPGNEIPMWFSRVNEGPSIKIKVPPHWDNDFLGFALSVVVACEHQCSSDPTCSFVFKYDYRLNINGQSYKLDPKFKRCSFLDQKKSSSDHVLIFYQHNDGKFLKKHCDYHDGVEASFNFSLEKSDFWGEEITFYSCKAEVKRCGIRMIYRSELDEFSRSNNQHGHEEFVSSNFV